MPNYTGHDSRLIAPDQHFCVTWWYDISINTGNETRMISFMTVSIINKFMIKQLLKNMLGSYFNVDLFGSYCTVNYCCKIKT